MRINIYWQHNSIFSCFFVWCLIVSKHSVGNSYECTPLSCVCWTERGERWESTVEKDHAEGRANDMDVGGPPCQYGLWWWQETWERTSRPFKFWRESDAGYLLWARELSSNLSSTHCFTFRGQSEHPYLWELLSLLWEICHTMVFLL